MEEWQAQMASQFKVRDNPKPMGSILGKVVRIGSNWLVTIKDGKFHIDKNNGYICNQILERKTDFDFNESGTHQNGYHGGQTSFSESGSGDVHLKEVWKAGDYLMVTPDESGQHYFIVDIVRM